MKRLVKPFIMGSFIAVAILFGITFLIERIFFAGASLQTLQYLYIVRGSTASILVMGFAVFFFRKGARQREAKLEELFQILEKAPISIVITDPSPRIEYINPRFTELTGYTPQEVVGKNPRLLQSGKTPLEQYQRLWAAIGAGKEWRGELLNRKKSGDLYWEALFIRPVLDSRGKISHYVGVLEDITELKKLEELKNEFVGVMSHELRTPLTILLWSIQNLRDGVCGPLQSRQAEVLERMAENCDRLKRQIADSLDLTRLESGKMKIYLKRIDPLPLLKETVDHFQTRALSRRLHFEKNIPEDLPPLTTDPDLVIRILSNLLDNAFRFAERKVAVEAQREGVCLRISVVNDGPAVAKEDFEIIFNKFEQAKRLARKKDDNGYHGTGLGLAICRESVERLGGKIWVESEPDRGAAFHFTLPLEEVAT